MTAIVITGVGGKWEIKDTESLETISHGVGIEELFKAIARYYDALREQEKE